MQNFDDTIKSVHVKNEINRLVNSGLLSRHVGVQLKKNLGIESIKIVQNGFLNTRNSNGQMFIYVDSSCVGESYSFQNLLDKLGASRGSEVKITIECVD